MVFQDDHADRVGLGQIALTRRGASAGIAATGWPKGKRRLGLVRPWRCYGTGPAASYRSLCPVITQSGRVPCGTGVSLGCIMIVFFPGS